MSAGDSERDKRTAWENLCLESGWVCKLCGAIPDIGKRFDGDLCDDCKLSVKNEW